MKTSLLLGVIAACFFCLAASSGAEESRDYLSGPGHVSFDQGMASAKRGNWSMAEYGFIEADNDNPNLPQVWFNLGLAESHMPGHEIRAAALMKAVLLRQPDHAQRDEINRLRLKLETTVRERIRSILAGLVGPAGNFVGDFICESQDALARVAEAQMRAGLFDDARVTIYKYREHPRCDHTGMDEASLAARAATHAPGPVSIAELHELGRNGLEFSGNGYKVPLPGAACYLDVPGQQSKRLGKDVDLIACLDASKKNAYGYPAPDWQVLERMLGLANILSDGLNLVH